MSMLLGLDYQMNEGKLPLRIQFSSKDFLSSLINILKMKNDVEVQVKILYLFEKWRRRLEKDKNIIPNFSEVYNNLKNNGISFLNNVQSTYYKYIQDGGGYNNNNYNNNYNDNYNNNNYNNNYNNNNYNNNYMTIITIIIIIITTITNLIITSKV